LDLPSMEVMLLEAVMVLDVVCGRDLLMLMPGTAVDTVVMVDTAVDMEVMVDTVVDMEDTVDMAVDTDMESNF